MEVDITNKAKKYTRIGLLSLIILAVAAGAGVYYYQHHNNYLTVYDAHVAGKTTAVRTKAAGTITDLKVADGDHVEAGDVIAVIDPGITEEQIQQLEQNLALTKQNLEQLQKGTKVTLPTSPTPQPTVDAGAQQRAAQAYARMQRMNELYSMGAVSAVKRDEAAADYYSAQAAANQSGVSASAPSAPSVTAVPVNPEIIKQAEAQVKQAEAALANAKEDQQSTEILAPVSGTVLLEDALQEGASLKADQMLANIQNPDDAWIEARLPEEQAQKIRLGQFVTYTINGHELQGSVQDILDPAFSEDSDRAGTSDAMTDASSSGHEADPATITDGRFVIKLSIPSGLTFDIPPGTNAQVKFLLRN